MLKNAKLFPLGTRPSIITTSIPYNKWSCTNPNKPSQAVLYNLLSWSIPRCLVPTPIFRDQNTSRKDQLMCFRRLQAVINEPKSKATISTAASFIPNARPMESANLVIGSTEHELERNETMSKRKKSLTRTQLGNKMSQPNFIWAEDQQAHGEGHVAANRSHNTTHTTDIAP